jgi:transcription initiation factor TFIID subunit 5
MVPQVSDRKKLLCRMTSLSTSSSAAALYNSNSLAFLPNHTVLLSTIRSLSLPSHVASDALSQRFRTERYIVKMSTTVFSLLLGWLTDGGGPVGGAGDAHGVRGEGTNDQDRRGREAMLKILNERCRIQVLNVKAHELTSAILEEGTGLTGAGPTFSSRGAKSRQYPALDSVVVSERDAVSDYNTSAAGPRLKLGGKIPLSEKLQAEVQKEAKMEESADKASSVSATKDQGKVLQPEYEDLPPQAPIYRTIDIEREVARLRDARKALRFDLSLNASSSDSLSGPSFLTGVRDPTFNGMGEEGAKAARVAGLPSVCAYTYHDAVDGLTSSTFSGDLTLMAAGFEESYVQLWSLKGESLRGFKNDFALPEVRDKHSLDKHREKTTLSTRKLIGHSGPVYDVSFDPSGGSIAPPKHLLSASGDGTTRLWSLDTLTALVSYRGHQQPIWSVEWSPLGIYFATASADSTARLWSTERINPLRMYAGHLSDVDCLNFHPNSLYLATGSSDQTCRLWDVQRGACVRLFVGHQSSIGCVKISPDGRYLASAGAGNAPSNSTAAAGDDYAISIWDLGSGRRIKKMWGHRSRVLSMDFSTDGGLLVTSGADCQVNCWDVRGAGGARKMTNAVKNIDGINTEVSELSNGASEGTIPLPSTKSHANKVALAALEGGINSSSDCISTFYTKKTPMLDVHFTPRNLCVVAGAFDASI